MESKWWFIYRVLNNYGYKGSAHLALAIHYSLKNIYGDVETKQWRKYKSKFERVLFANLPKDKMMSLVRSVVMDREFCIACVKSLYTCRNCEWSDKFGKCTEKNSLFQYFVKLMEIEYGKEIKSEMICWDTLELWVLENQLDEENGYLAYMYGIW